MSVEHIPARGPMVDKNGVVTQEWLAWFREVAALDVSADDDDDDDDDSGGGGTTTIIDSSTGTIPASRMPAFVGDVTTVAGDVTTTIAPGVVTTSKLANLAVTTAKLEDGAVTEPKLGFAAVTTTKILDSAVTLAKIQNIATDRVLGRSTALSGVVEELSTLPEAVQLNITKLGQLATHVIPDSTDVYDVGSPSALWSQGYFAQLNAILFALETQTLFGGYSTIGHDAGNIGFEVQTTDTTVDFGKAMTPGDFILIRGQDFSGTFTAEYMQVGSLVSGTTYNVTRNLSGLGLKKWTKGIPYLVLGTTGDGRIDLFAYDGRPRILFVEQGATYSSQSLRGVVGNMNSYYGYATDTYGLAFGNESGSNLTIDPTNGLRIRSSTTTYAQMASGVFTLGLSAGNRVEWNGTNLTVVSQNVTINSTGVLVQPSAVDAFTSVNGFRWNVVSGTMGISGYDSGVPLDTRVLHATCTDQRGLVQLSGGNSLGPATVKVGYSALLGSGSIQLTATNGLRMSGSSIGLTGPTTIIGATAVTGTVTVSSTLGVTGAVTMSSTASVAGIFTTSHDQIGRNLRQIKCFASSIPAAATMEIIRLVVPYGSVACRIAFVFQYGPNANFALEVFLDGYNTYNTARTIGGTASGGGIYSIGFDSPTPGIVRMLMSNDTGSTVNVQFAVDCLSPFDGFGVTSPYQV